MDPGWVVYGQRMAVTSPHPRLLRIKISRFYVSRRCINCCLLDSTNINKFHHCIFFFFSFSRFFFFVFSCVPTNIKKFHNSVFCLVYLFIYLFIYFLFFFLLFYLFIYLFILYHFYFSLFQRDHVCYSVRLFFGLTRGKNEDFVK